MAPIEANRSMLPADASRPRSARSNAAELPCRDTNSAAARREVLNWLDEAAAEKEQAELALAAAMQLAPPTLSTEEIVAAVEHCGGLTGILHQATDEERAALYEAIGVSAVYNPEHNQVRLGADPVASNACRRGACPVRAACTTSGDGKRTKGFPPRELLELQVRNRADQQDPAWHKRYAVRSGIEGTVCQLAHGHGMRHCRYRGQPKAHLQHVLTAIAVNIERLSQLPPGESTSPRPPTAFQDYLDQHDIQRLRSWRAVS